MPNLLVELGIEELPSPLLDVVYQELPARAAAAFKENHIPFKTIRVEATPRRIALAVEGLPEKQENQVLEFTGPAVKAAYDEAGKPTKALQGFLKSKQAKLQDVQTKELPKGEVIYVKKKITGKKVSTLLPALLEELFVNIPFPKAMRWESSGFKFPRPLRWVVALLDKQVVKLKIAGIQAGNKSLGHRFLAPKPFKIISASWANYLKVLKKQHVVLELAKREKYIRDQLGSKYSQHKLDEELVHITAQLVEEPFLLSGSFSKTYLELPAEVLALCMKKNQKIFACYDRKGKLNGKFVAVLNGKRKGLAKISADFENVLESRLKDAQFFFNEDVKNPLAEKAEELSQIVYLGKLGHMLDKAKRIESLAVNLSDYLGRKDVQGKLKRAAYLSKADLLTQLVYEFPELQGIAGREYALENKEDDEVAIAIGEQYLPKNLSEDYKDVKKSVSVLGALLGILDRLDLLVGAFGTGVEPSGSQDPFALRRAGGIFVKLIRAFGLHFSLRELVEASAKLYGNSLDLNQDDIYKKLTAFFRERVAFELQIDTGSREHEIFEAVWRSSSDEIADVYNRFEILTALCDRDAEIFMKAAKVVERTSNILKSAKRKVGDKVQPSLFQEPLEKELYQIIETKSDEILETLDRREYEKVTRIFGQSFYQPIHDFFEQIMVNAEDSAVRENRQALMKRVNSLYADRLADLSVLSRIDIE